MVSSYRDCNLSSAGNKIMELFKLEKTSKIIKSNSSPCTDTCNTFTCSLNTFKDGESITALVSLLQCLSNIFLVSNLNLSCWGGSIWKQY